MAKGKFYKVKNKLLDYSNLEKKNFNEKSPLIGYLYDLYTERFVEPIDVAGDIEGKVEETKMMEGETQGVSIGAPVVVSSDDNSSNTAFVDQRPPADDEGLRESEKERSSYFGN